MNKQCILYLCQDICEESIYRYNKLLQEKPNNYDLYWLIDNNKFYTNLDTESINFLSIIDNNDKKKKYTKLYYSWEKPNDIENSGKHYNCILNYIEAYNKIPSYDYYWCIEFDVYMHNFADLFNYYDNIDYDNISSHLVNNVPNCYSDNNNPVKSLFNVNNIYNINRYPVQFTAFYSISRLSNRLLKLCLDYYKGGNFGFFESTITMLTIYNNLSITTLNDYFISVTPENKSYLFQVDVSSNSWGYHITKKYIDYFLQFNKIIHPVKMDMNIKTLKAR